MNEWMNEWIYLYLLSTGTMTITCTNYTVGRTARLKEWHEQLPYAFNQYKCHIGLHRPISVYNTAAVDIKLYQCKRRLCLKHLLPLLRRLCFHIVCLILRRITRKLLHRFKKKNTKFGRKVAHGKRKKPWNFGDNPDRVTLGLGLG